LQQAGRDFELCLAVGLEEKPEARKNIMSFNKITIVGNLGRDPELRYTPQGTAVCSFTMATNEKRKDKNGMQQDFTTWFRVTVWGKQAETVSKYLTKGRSVYVEGRLHIEEWQDKDGKQRYTLEVNGTDVHFIDSASSAGNEGIPVRAAAAGGAGNSSRIPAGNRAPQGAAEIDEDEIPF
jgi:single-strand DNA-binding protein